MKGFLTFSQVALSKIWFAPIYALLGPKASAMANSESSDRHDLNWQEDYLIGMSDRDAIWYYERRRWRSSEAS